MTTTDLEVTPYPTNGSGSQSPKNITVDDDTKAEFVAACAKIGLTQKRGIVLAVKLLSKVAVNERKETEEEKVARLAGEL